ncbi:glycosyltransferase [Oribacterium sp. P6A1]|uniref:glycosyltransferase n=1 Tax=Oribacterium sp. P6A1 TaxID=1410612 RepID=UPI00055AC732|nr:glycosyltransferase [Oribacterium sp. P6A1]
MKKLENRIPVVFTPDEKFVIPTCVAIASMMESRREAYYFFYLVLDSSLKWAESYFSAIKDVYNEFEYKIIWIEEATFKQGVIKTEHLSQSAFYRLFLPDLIKTENKIMYHDGDILVCDDLKKMYDVDLKDNYIGGIPSIYAAQEDEWSKAKIDKWGFASTEGYVFSGDLIINLQKLRTDNITKIFSSEIMKGYPSEDQDIINKVCYGHIALLPLRYCMLNRWTENDTLELFTNPVYSYQEICDAKNNPAIIHFAGADAKPWLNLRVSYGELWWNTLKRIVGDEVYKRMRDIAQENTECRDWSYLWWKLQLCMNKAKEVVIYGAGKNGKELLESLNNNGISVSGFLDMNSEKCGTFVDGVEIFHVNTDSFSKRNTIVIVSVTNGFDEIKKYLIQKGYENELILRYYHKSNFYYQSIAAEYQEYEQQDACLRCGKQIDQKVI